MIENYYVDFPHRWSVVYLGPGLQGAAGSGHKRAIREFTPACQVFVSDPSGPGRCRWRAELRPLCLWRSV